MKEPIIHIHERDNVAVAIEEAAGGEEIVSGGIRITPLESIPAGHKVALQPIKEGEDILKYGNPIGHAVRDIERGEWVHSHNTKTNLSGKLDYTYEPREEPAAQAPVDELTFQGYRRPNGEVGIRNEIWIINTVGCINKSAELLADMASKELEDSDEVDGVFHFPHPFGCSQLGDDLTNTQRVLSSLVLHPNAVGVVVMGLGCENNTIKSFQEMIGEKTNGKVVYLGAQDVDDEIEEGMELIGELTAYANSFKREPVPVSELKVGLKCGGSDGLSGITGNPLVGSFSNRLIAHGGTTILTEVPEMFGAEKLLMSRAQNEEVFDNTVKLVNNFKQYFLDHDQNVYENPSPGNKDGGITTLEEKSLGCVQKGGSATVVDVLEYAGRATTKGLNLLQGPGNDLVSVTNLAAAGAHIILFTTGRGTPFGGPVPTVKISTNTALAEKKKRWIDFNAGEFVEGKPLETLTDEFMDDMIAWASGTKQTQNEKYNFKEIAIFKDGVIL
ncbi:UxaA family hydrolase [Salibacterium halotolerans]|uniref:Altronate hydrolase n=1 Tax=Salibacterium halotolerans TaxID=1884432 RepID=A0A1I5X566_9BACI|nr:altronate dehydratase family protein [Salibacterium halotolerans]SFQ27064.1 altronate hydrolase [Salibacterium halotolerans]